MSCFVVPDFHIDALVSWAADRGACCFFVGMTPVGLAAALHDANCTAYRCRYGEAVGEEYRFTRRAVTLSPVQVIKACDCLEYQCSDWPDWSESVAARALARVRDHAISMLPGYEEARWTLDQGVAA